MGYKQIVTHYTHRISLLLTLVLSLALDSCNNNDILLVVGYNYNCIYIKNFTYYLCIMCIYTIATIKEPPGNTAVCSGDDVIIDCGYDYHLVSSVTWIINGTSFSESAIVNNPSYQHINLDMPGRYSLRVYSINGTTTFQCTIASDPNVTSTEGKVTVIGMWDAICYICMCSVHV